MENLKCLFLISLFGLCSFPAVCQQTYEARHYGEPGTLYLYNRLSGMPADSVVEAGADVQWDLTSFTGLNTHPIEIITPSEGINQFTFLAICTLSDISPTTCFNIWANTEQAILLQDSISLLTLNLENLQRYQRITNSQLLETFFGFDINFGGNPMQAVIVYPTPDTVLQFPVTYEDSWTSVVSWSIDLTATGQDLRYKSTQSRTSEVDAWGTILTPYDTFTNVVRVRSEVHHQDTLFQANTPLPIDIIQLEYLWFDTLYKVPVMIASGAKVDSLELINRVEYIYEATCPEPTWTLQIDTTVFFLNDSGEVTIDFVIDQSNANEYSWNFGDFTTGTSEGSISHTYFTPGQYTVDVTGCMTNCLPLNSCTFAIVDFTIELMDATQVIPGEKAGVHVYPNPCNDYLQLEIPDWHGPVQYSISDMTGRVVMSAFLKSDNTRIATGNLANGTYQLLLSRGDKPSELVISRFTVLR